MPGGLYFHRENDIISLVEGDYIGSSGMIQICFGVGSTGADLLFDRFANIDYNMLTKGAGR